MTYNVEAEYKLKSMKELQRIEKQFADAKEKHPTLKMANEHLQYVRMCIAERIGKKNK